MRDGRIANAGHAVVEEVVYGNESAKGIWKDARTVQRNDKFIIHIQ